MEENRTPLPITTLMLDVMAELEECVHADGMINWNTVDQALLPVLMQIADLEHEIERQKIHDDVQIALKLRQIQNKIDANTTIEEVPCHTFQRLETRLEHGGSWHIIGEGLDEWMSVGRCPVCSVMLFRDGSTGRPDSLRTTDEYTVKPVRLIHTPMRCPLNETAPAPDHGEPLDMGTCKPRGWIARLFGGRS